MDGAILLAAASVARRRTSGRYSLVDSSRGPRQTADEETNNRRNNNFGKLFEGAWTKGGSNNKGKWSPMMASTMTGFVGPATEAELLFADLLGPRKVNLFDQQKRDPYWPFAAGANSRNKKQQQQQQRNNHQPRDPRRKPSSYSVCADPFTPRKSNHQPQPPAAGKQSSAPVSLRRDPTDKSPPSSTAADGQRTATDSSAAPGSGTKRACLPSDFRSESNDFSSLKSDFVADCDAYCISDTIMANGFTADENGRLIELPQFWVMVVFLLDAPEGDGSTRKVKAQSPLALARGSPTFRRMLSEPWVSGYERDNGSLLVPIRAVDWRCFENVIRFLETNHVEIGSTPTALGTLSLSLHYLVYPLAARCVEYLINVNLNPNEVLHVLDVIALPNHLYAPSAPPADREDALLPATSSAGGGEIPSEVDGAGVEHSWDKRFQSALNRLAKHCLDLISRDSERVLKNDALEELGPDALKRILSLDALSVKGESDVFDAVVRWGTFRCRNRSTDLDPNPENLRKCIGDDVLFSVRFLTMSPDDFLRASLLVRFEDDERAFFLAPVSRARAPPHLAPHLDSMSRPRRFLATAAGGPNGNDDNTNNRRSSWRRCFRARSDRRTRSNAGAGEDDHSCLLMGFVSCIACIFE